MMFFREETNVAEPSPTALYAAFAGESEANDWTVVNRLAVARVYSSVADEYRALTSAVAAVDLGALRRYTLRGPDAGDVISRLTSAPADELNVGETARGLMLAGDAHVIDVCDVTRLAGEVYLLTVSQPCDRRLQISARRADVEVENISDDVAALGLFGPGADEAARAAGFDGVDVALAVQGRVRGVEAFARPARLGSVTGHELIFPAEEALVLWQRVKRAASATPAGLAACEAVRIEGGAPRPGVDFTPSGLGPESRFPAEIGLPHLAPTDRAWFNGRRALTQAQEADADRRRNLVTVQLAADEAVPGAPVFAAIEGRRNAAPTPIGHISSGSFSPRHHAALAFIEVAAGVRVERLWIGHEGRADAIEARLFETPEGALAADFQAAKAAPTESRSFFV